MRVESYFRSHHYLTLPTTYRFVFGGVVLHPQSEKNKADKQEGPSSSAYDSAFADFPQSSRGCDVRRSAVGLKSIRRVEKHGDVRMCVTLLVAFAVRGRRSQKCGGRRQARKKSWSGRGQRFPPATAKGVVAHTRERGCVISWETGGAVLNAVVAIHGGADGADGDVQIDEAAFAHFFSAWPSCPRGMCTWSCWLPWRGMSHADFSCGRACAVRGCHGAGINARREGGACADGIHVQMYLRRLLDARRRRRTRSRKLHWWQGREWGLGVE